MQNDKEKEQEEKLKKEVIKLFKPRFRKVFGGNQDAFAKVIGVSRNTVGSYARGNALPNSIQLRKIAEYCGVSTDWLLGLSDAQSPDISAACSFTGLSTNAIENVIKIKNNDDGIGIDFLNILLSSKQFYDFLTSLNRYSVIAEE